MNVSKQFYIIHLFTNANTEYPPPPQKKKKKKKKRKMAFHYISATRYEYGSIKTNTTTFHTYERPVGVYCEYCCIK